MKKIIKQPVDSSNFLSNINYFDNFVSERQTPYAKRSDDGLRCFKITGAKDILNQLGPISKTEYDYYENL